jgi:hypothetical protein
VSSTDPQTWQLATPAQPTTSGTRTTIQGKQHTLSIERVAPASATASVHDYTTDSDFNGGFRLDEAVAAGDQRYLHVLWIDGAVGSVSAAGADGATIVLANGTSATIQFSHDAIGGTMMIGSSSTTLGTGVDTLPEE